MYQIVYIQSKNVNVSAVVANFTSLLRFEVRTVKGTLGVAILAPFFRTKARNTCKERETGIDKSNKLTNTHARTGHRLYICRHFLSFFYLICLSPAKTLPSSIRSHDHASCAHKRIGSVYEMCRKEVNVRAKRTFHLGSIHCVSVWSTDVPIVFVFRTTMK